ncbi:MAG: phosphotransferase, partial [Prevotella sp.]|nr:phosphotransferase [Prevotella sp.]
MESLLQLFQQYCGESPATTEKLAGAGSNRQYYRFTDSKGRAIIGVLGTSRDENHAFVYLARHFTHRQLPVPKVLAVSDDEMCYLQEDLGNVSLFDALRGGREAGGRYNQKEKQLLVETIRQLPNIQIRGARGLDWNNCYPQPEFDVDSVLFDLNYFKYCFLKPVDIDFHELKLEANFRLFAKDLTSEPSDSFLYRDFQERNVMLCLTPDPSHVERGEG